MPETLNPSATSNQNRLNEIVQNDSKEVLLRMFEHLMTKE